MDPADADSLHQVLATQGILVGRHKQTLQDIMEEFQVRSTHVIRLCMQLICKLSVNSLNNP